MINNPLFSSRAERIMFEKAQYADIERGHGALIRRFSCGLRKSTRPGIFYSGSGMHLVCKVKILK